MSLEPATRARIQSLIDANDVLLFMKGNREAPQCGFSATVIGLLDQLVPDYATFDILSDPEIREGVKEFSSWPTIPQLYVKGEFLGGCDIVEETFASGELHERLGVERGDVTTADIRITKAAAEQLRLASADAPPGHALHLGVDARFQSRLYLGPAQDGGLEIESEGIVLRLDSLTAGRAQGAVIDLVKARGGAAFRVQLPAAPNAVQSLVVKDLKALLDSGTAFELFDVRTPDERATAHIEGSVLMDPEQARRIEDLPRDTMLVFHCHHGGRSQAAAEHFAAMGFVNVHNVAGGIDAWSLEVDPAIPRY